LNIDYEKYRRVSTFHVRVCVYVPVLRLHILLPHTLKLNCDMETSPDKDLQSNCIANNYSCW